jgi:hypothetical protein
MEALRRVDHAFVARGDIFLGHPMLRTLISPSYMNDTKVVAAKSTMMLALTSVATIITYLAGHDDILVRK